MWDVGGEDKIRPLWRYYYQDAVGIIWVIDSADIERLSEVQEELKKVLREEELQGMPLLIFLNKQDLPMALPAGEIAYRLEIETYCKGRSWWVQPCSFASGAEKELMAGIDWLFATIHGGI